MLYKKGEALNKRVLLIGGVAVVAVVLGVILFVNKIPSRGFAASSLAIQELYDSALALEEKNELFEAKEAYQKIISDYPDYKDIAGVQKRLETLAIKIIFSATATPKTENYEVKPGDSIAKIAKQYNTTIELIKRSNNLVSDMIRVGQRLRVWKGVFSVFVDKSQNILILKSDDEVVKVYNVATGKNNSTPVGTFKVVDKLVNPVWFKSGAIVPPESPDNILGTRWMGFDVPGYGIHGTTDPNSVGQQLTAGCVRMLNEEVEEIYSLLPAGTQVTIVD